MPDLRPPWMASRRHSRPPWWPENEPWSPHGRWPSHRGRFFRRVGCLFAILITFGVVSLFTLIVLLLDRLGFLRSSQEVLGWAFPIAIGALLLTAGAIFIAGRNLRRLSMPLDEMLAASDRVAEGDYSARVEEQGPAEIRSLAHAFNTMAARLKASDQQRRNMLADVSHELRTPLTVIQGNVEGMLDGLYPTDEKTLKSILEETHLLSRLVDDLRTLALAESGSIQLKREMSDPGMLISEVVEGFQLSAAAAGILLDVWPGKSSPKYVDPSRIREILSNLISNALRYTPRGGKVIIRVEGETVSVEDDGPGISPADLPHIFERYYKSSDSGGMGLGLSIARYLVEAHGGEIRAESPPGSGTRISFTLPG